MKNQLSIARKNYRKVIITAHIPPGFFECTEKPYGPMFKVNAPNDINNDYIEIILNYSDVVSCYCPKVLTYRWKL